MVSPDTPQNSFTVLRSLKPSLSQIAVKDMNKLDSTALKVNFSQIKRKEMFLMEEDSLQLRYVKA